MRNRHSKSGEDEEKVVPSSKILTLQRQQEACNAANYFTSKFAETVRRRRQKLELTQEELVSALQNCGIKVSQGYISLLEAGQRKEPNMRLIVALAVLLDISLDKLSGSNGGDNNA